VKEPEVAQRDGIARRAGVYARPLGSHPGAIFSMIIDLSSRIALITGASRGIGRAIAMELAGCGASVAINCKASIDLANDVAREIAGRGVDVLVIQADVSKEDRVAEMTKQVISKFGRLDILVNNAGITSYNLAARMPLRQWDSVLATDLTAAFLCSKMALPSMVRHRWGRIINISSIVGLFGQVGQSNYAAAKSGLIGLTKSLALEYGPRGITVNAIAPGLVESDMTAALPPRLVEEALKHVSAGRLGKPEDVGYLCAVLCSERASYINGELICVDGGIGLTSR
jgi:3-oxoacyl-[acyl-carrier protein] reductase